MLSKNELLLAVEEELLVQKSVLSIICLANESGKLESDDATNALLILMERLEFLTASFKD